MEQKSSHLPSPDVICHTLQFSIATERDLEEALVTLQMMGGNKWKMACLKRMFLAWKLPPFNTLQEAFRIFRPWARSRLPVIPSDVLDNAFTEEKKTEAIEHFEAIDTALRATRFNAPEFTRLVEEFPYNFHFEVDWDAGAEMVTSFLESAILLENAEALQILLNAGGTFQASDLDPAILFLRYRPNHPIWAIYFANGGDEKTLRDQFAELELDEEYEGEEDAVIQAIVQASAPAAQYLLGVGTLPVYITNGSNK